MRAIIFSGVSGRRKKFGTGFPPKRHEKNGLTVEMRQAGFNGILSGNGCLFI